MTVSIEAKGVFPVAIYAIGGDFMRASKLQECGAVISLVEEMRQMGEVCDVSKVATVLFAGRLKVARRILQPLVDSELIVMDSSGCLSLCENEEVRQASLSLSELRFEPPERGYKLVLMPQNVSPSAKCLVSGFRVVENLPRGFLLDRFFQVSSSSPVHERIMCVSCQKPGPFIMKMDTNSKYVIYMHDKSNLLKIRYHFIQEQEDGIFQSGELKIRLEGDDIKEKHWGWLMGPLQKMAGKGEWEVSVSTPADDVLFSSLLKINGCVLSDVPGYVRSIPSDDTNQRYGSIFNRQNGLSVTTEGLTDMPDNLFEAKELAIERLVKDAMDGKVTTLQPQDYVLNFCRNFGYDVKLSTNEIETDMKALSDTMDGAAYARFFAAMDWRLSK